MITLETLTNVSRPKKKVQRVGRGMGSGRGKTSCRGHKGDKSRSGYKRRYGKEGGQLPLYRKIPARGFTNGLFRSVVYSINFTMIDQYFEDGEVVSLESLQEKGVAPRRILGGLKILSVGDLTKKVSIEAHFYSKQAIEKLQKKSIAYKVLS
ncbi:MAG: 50S ribosomal protein L15 [Chlamydiae bacterium]|jgi:large subunit ribosomal protein L15|nr:50S ribosomal protein L15 [Chlamydiota bacterium]